MPFLTLNELMQRPFVEAPKLNESLRRNVDPSSEEKRTFLFYHVKDKDRLSTVVNILKSLRINLYVDYIEADNFQSGDKIILPLIRDRLYKADKAILLATPLSSMNPGFPLDFGLNGKFQHTRKVTVFPVTQDPQRWEDRSHFEPYGYIQKKYSYFNFPDDWQIVFPEGDRMLLKEWLIV